MIPIRDQNPTTKTPWVTIAIIVVNVIVFVYELMLDAGGQLDAAIRSWAVVPYYVTHKFSLDSALDMIRAMFMHGGWWHLIGNMVYLWVFGDNVENAFGSALYALFYFACGLVATVVQVAISPNSMIPVLGASGAIAGVLGAYILFFPRARIISLVPFGYFMRLVAVPAYISLGFWFIIQLFNGVLSLGIEAAGGVAWFAHIGGFLAGLGMAWLYKRLRPPEPGPPYVPHIGPRPPGLW